MNSFQAPDKELVERYEQEAPHCAPVKRPARASRYEKDASGNYIYDAGAAEHSATILCAGDMLCEEKLYNAHYDGMRYYFHDIFSFIRPEFKKADLVIGNLETTICESYPYTGEQYKVDGKYHNNAPVEFLDAIWEAGFDLLTLANNHCVDTGFAGAMETLHRIDERGMMRTGLFRPEDDRRFCLAEVNGIPIAVLSYSTWFNRNQDRLTERGRREIINIYEPEKVKQDVQTARAAGAEFVLVYIHWGIDAEYKSQKSASMVKTAQELADAGVDYIVGSHTHSVQEYDHIVSSDGRVVPCMYSVGNFVTSEINRISRETLILRIQLKKTGQGVEIAAEEIVPCYVLDSVCGIAYPIVPETAKLGAERTVECQSAFSRIKTAAGDKYLEERPFLTTSNIAEILGIKRPGFNTVYTTLNFAMDARKDGVAIVSNITSDPQYRTSDERCEELAEIAMKKGAKLLIAKKQMSDYPTLVVEDPFAAYTTIITSLRKRFNPKTVSITGSIGKTTATEMVYYMLNSRFKTHRNTGSANNVRYAGTVVQQLKKEHEVYVQETMEGPPYGAASTISKMVQPQAAIVTVVGTSHMEAFGSQERILESCLGVQDGMSEDGLLVLNGDDPLQYQARGKCTREVVCYGVENADADYRAINIHGEGDCLSFDVLHEGRSTPVQIHCFGRHNVLNALAAFAIGKWAGMTDDEVVIGLGKFRTSGIRQNLVSYGGHRLFLDCYNAAVESVHSALDALSMIAVPSDGRRIGVLADVLETGAGEDEYHREIGRAAASSCLDLLFCYGKNAAYIAEEAKAGSFPVYYTESAAELIKLLKKHVTEADVTLFKGSHGMELEKIVDLCWGTWLHEEFERYDFKTRIASDENFRYQIYSDHATVINKISEASDVIIPDTIEGLPVAGIERNTFNRSKYTASIKFPAGLVNIRYCAFYKANRISEIDLPASLRIIDTSAFSTCENLEKVTIADGCTHLGYRAFGNCKKLKSITIPASVRQIGNEAFINCALLTIYGEAGSCAEAYAKKRGIPFVVK